ncbi:uncharacterized protein [Lolium perenne]|uniref:uncharacterized protein n=1 Tax=Lolium perenne TaxID=4522 RepID=UPI003A99768D
MNRSASRRLVRRRACALVGRRAALRRTCFPRLARGFRVLLHAGEVVQDVRTWRRSSAVLHSVLAVDQTVASPPSAPGRLRAGMSSSRRGEDLKVVLAVPYTACSKNILISVPSGFKSDEVTMQEAFELYKDTGGLSASSYTRPSIPTAPPRISHHQPASARTRAASYHANAWPHLLRSTPQARPPLDPSLRAGQLHGQATTSSRPAPASAQLRPRVARTCPRISPQLHQTGRSLPGPSSPRSQLIRPPRARSHPAPSQRLLKSWLDQFPLRFYTQTTPKHPRRCASIPLAARHARNPRTRPHPSGFSSATPRPAPAATRNAKSCIPAGSPLLLPAAPAAGFGFRSCNLRLHLARSFALLTGCALPAPAPAPKNLRLAAPAGRTTPRPVRLRPVAPPSAAPASKDLLFFDRRLRRAAHGRLRPRAAHLHPASVSPRSGTFVARDLLLDRLRVSLGRPRNHASPPRAPPARLAPTVRGY